MSYDVSRDSGRPEFHSLPESDKKLESWCSSGYPAKRLTLWGPWKDWSARCQYIWLGEKASCICAAKYLSVTADPSPRFTFHVAGTLSKQPTYKQTTPYCPPPTVWPHPQRLPDHPTIYLKGAVRAVHARAPVDELVAGLQHAQEKEAVDEGQPRPDPVQHEGPGIALLHVHRQGGGQSQGGGRPRLGVVHVSEGDEADTTGDTAHGWQQSNTGVLGMSAWVER